MRYITVLILIFVLCSCSSVAKTPANNEQQRDVMVYPPLSGEVIDLAMTPVPDPQVRFLIVDFEYDYMGYHFEGRTNIILDRI